MKIEVLYIAGCPSHPKAVELIKGILSAEGIAEEVHEVLISDERMAKESGFLGSPTIRINGCDVADDSRDPPVFGLSCRLYAGPTPGGLPPAQTVQRAVTRARKGARP